MALVQIANRYTDYFESGTSSASSPDYRTHYYIYYDDNQDVANNRTRIQIDYYLKMVGTRTPTDMSSGVYINGSSTNNYISIPKKSYSSGMHYLGSKDWYIYHDSSGNGSFTFRGILYGGGKWSNRYTTGTTTYTLPTIPRYASITSYSIWNNGLTQIGVYWNANAGCDAVQYSLNGGSWTGTGGNTFYIGNLSPGTQYSVRIRVKRTDSQLWTESGTLYATTTAINSITSANPSGNSDNELKVTATNPSGNRNDIKLEFPDLGLIEVLRKDETLNATFTIAEMESLASLIPDLNSTKLRATAVTVIDGVDTYWHYKDGTYTVINANPIFSNFEYEDINPTTLNLTGNNQTIIKGYSNLRARITSANKMEAIKGANPTEYQLVIGNYQTKENYHASNDVELTLNRIGNNVFIVYAIDSRGNSTQKQISPATYINYFKPTISELNINRVNNINTLTNLKFSGTFFNENFGATANELKATYSYKLTTTTTDQWSDFPEGDYHITTNKDGISNLLIDFRQYLSVGDEIRVKSDDSAPYAEYVVIEVNETFITLDGMINEPWSGTLLESVQYKSLWTFGGELDLNINGNEYEFDGNIKGDLNAEGFNIADSFDIKVIVTDLLESFTSSEVLVSAKPNLAMHKDGVALNGQYDENLESGVQINGDGVYYNGLLLFGWSDELPIAMKNEEEIMEIENEGKDDEFETKDTK